MFSAGSTTFIIILQVLIALFMFGLGLTVRPADFARVWKTPKYICVGLVIKLIALPAVAFVICWLFSLSNEYSVGFILLAGGPCSALANVFSRLAKGDVSLSVAFTAIDNALTSVTLPIFAAIALQYFMSGSQQIGLQFSESLKIAALILIPFLIGMAYAGRFPNTVVKLDRRIRILSIAVLVFLIVSVAKANQELLQTSFSQLAGAVITFNAISLVAGFWLSRLVGLTREQCISFAMAMGILGTTVVLAVGLSILHNVAFAMPAALYSLSMYLIGGAAVLLLNR